MHELMDLAYSGNLRSLNHIRLDFVRVLGPSVPRFERPLLDLACGVSGRLLKNDWRLVS